ncbi:hypothetical protein O6H91_14G020700 [Diphasiastrum complanatum]|uniref:Uncharacterized protein n=3 Tax=Diphasiastrum complanatum TaxID=34168 RepID=A0ACC2BM23_DIPCM|nr:hypothetical protein O6H91_14G020700 [Diphasiastrum complanatum]KAJ7530820.1 hypothetical protein O6H91_14G020700 [Diphasiastrum complanatum]KAJ7530822.1 hypothetical protein O6H91_14G020700 [Diphasiastrum complanatum]
MNSKSSYFSRKPEEKNIDLSSAIRSDSGPIRSNGNVSLNVDSSVSDNHLECVKTVNPSNVSNSEMKDISLDRDVDIQPAKDAISPGNSEKQLETGTPSDLLDLAGSTDAAQGHEVPSEHQIKTRRDNRSIQSRIEFLSGLSDCCTPNFPASFVPSSHDGKHILLDPNALEFSPSPSSSRALPLSGLSISVPGPFFGDRSGVDIGAIVYSSELVNGACPGLPLFGDSDPLRYGPASVAQSAWNGSPLGLILEAEISQKPSLISVPFVPSASICEQKSRANFHFQRTPPKNITSTFAPGKCTAGVAVPATIIGREHISRALLLSGVPIEINNIQLRLELEQWGPVRALGLGKRQEELVTVCYFDLRNAQDAFNDIQQQHRLQQPFIQRNFQKQLQPCRQSKQQCKDDIDPASGQDVTKAEILTQGCANHESASTKGLIGGKPVWAQYTAPCGLEAVPDSMNQGTLVVFNLDADVALDTLRTVFEVHGTVKELRETPARRQHKFVEFFDVRDAARALAALDGKEVCGKCVKIEFSRPGGQARRARAHAQLQQRYFSVSGSRAGPSSVISHVQGQEFLWGWNRDPVLCDGHSIMCPPQAYMWSNCGPMPSAASLPSLSSVAEHWNGPKVYTWPSDYAQHSVQASPNTSGRLFQGSEARTFAAVNGRSFGNKYPLARSTSRTYGAPMYVGLNKGHITEMEVSGRRGRLSSSDSGFYFHSNHQDFGEFRPLGFGGTRYTHHLGESAMSSKNAREIVLTQYVFDEFEAESSSNFNPRTTLMIRNIPNKYSQQMLLELLDQHCLQCNKQIVDPNVPLSAYDFMYLPIDFKNKCNLGYAFVNFTTVQATIKLYKAFHALQWEAFNSRKICQVTYARVQGKAALEEHFRNSRFNCEINEYLPLIFSPPRTGIVCPTPTVAVRSSSNYKQEHHGNFAHKDGDYHDNNEEQQSKLDCKCS